MTTYIIGDIHGAAQTFEDLLSKISYNSKKDELFLVGDLVNNGPDSAQVVRLAKELNAKVTLGNHDLHMLAVAFGAAKPRKKDTFQDLLHAQDADALIDWLRHQHLFLQHDSFWMAHAGIHPSWDLATTLEISHAIEEALQSKNPASFFEHMYGNDPIAWSSNLSREEQLRFGINSMTRMRALHTPAHTLEFKYKATLDTMPETLQPWFVPAHNRTTQPWLFFGHWSALGLHTHEPTRTICLDSGCTWGKQLTAYNPHTHTYEQVDTRKGEAASH